MNNLYFQRANETYLLIKENVTSIKEALKEISVFLERHNYQSHYIRVWGDEVVEYDVGSWTEFFYLGTKEDIEARGEIVGTEADFVEREDN
jgi:hypothetical protein